MSPWAKPSILIAYGLAFLACPVFFLIPGLPEGPEFWPWAGNIFSPPMDTPAAATIMHWLSVICWEVHFARRFIETCRASYVRQRPIYELGALYLPVAAGSAYEGWTLRPASCSFDLENGSVVFCAILGLFLFVGGEIGNAWHHAALEALRFAAPPKDAATSSSASGHRIPYGSCFELVSMPHYLCELVAFVGFLLLAPTLASAACLLSSLLNLVPRALEAHRKYQSEFQDYPKQRKAIVPWLL